MANNHQSRNDETTEATARDVYENVRELNHATAHPPGLTRPGTAYTILGNLAAAAHGLYQTLHQLHRFLNDELDAGRLGHDRGHEPGPYIFKVQESLVDAGLSASDLGRALEAAQNALAAINGEPELNARHLAAASFPTSITDALLAPSKADPPEPPPAPPGGRRPGKEA